MIYQGPIGYQDARTVHAFPSDPSLIDCRGVGYFPKGIFPSATFQVTSGNFPNV